MNRVFDYNGTIVSPSNPVKSLTTVKKMLAIDSADRDTTKYRWNNDFVVYLPRVYENVVNVRLVAAEFPNGSPYEFSTSATLSSFLSYFMIDIEGLNKSDECSIGADRSGYPDGYFAKIPTGNSSLTVDAPIFYSDHSAQENNGRYTPAIGKLDRLHIRIRKHDHKGKNDSLYWKNQDETSLDYSLTFEIEMLDNAFDDHSSFESRIMNRGASAPDK
uniref:Uncharacterized protein n=1 Tax=viral metagenome TaxID=1070528 RepID=A0A6C0ERQ9_9ZZZZ